jgi:IMP dehydrogenase|uniref:IMP dehydrogenase n=1 Tax=viral metagenome TaxID=1070528 RepID=A0A6C0AMA2_9ZZZZ
MNEIKETYSFDDILIEPRYSDIKSRADISLKTKLSDKITLNIPIISSPMDTVTEDSMAIEMAMSGGLGIIHRFQSLESQVSMIKMVKRHLSNMIERPYTIDYTCSLEELLSKYNTSGIMVVDENKKFVGIVSKRDIEIHHVSGGLNSVLVKDIMTPLERVKYVEKYDIIEIMDIYKKYKVEKVPVLDSDNSIIGLVVLKNLVYFYKNKDVASLDSNGRLLVGAAVGINDYMERSKELVKVGVDVLCIDIANGYNKMMYNAIVELKKEFPSVTIMAGNVCTKAGFEFLCKAGADCIRVNIGAGSICSTRIQTGIGVCQFSALMECSKVAKEYDVTMISDGGHCGKVGNKFKALAVGSGCVLLGKSLAGTKESPGNIIYKSGKRFKYYRGMASMYANLSKQERTGGDLNKNFYVEGIEGEVEYKGNVIDELNRICNGMRSGMSYLGVRTISELHETEVVFNRVTSSGLNETLTRL